MAEHGASGPSRRRFLEVSGLAAAAAVVPRKAAAAAASRVIGANDRIRMGVIGVGGMGGAHLRAFIDFGKNNEENVEVIAVCDIYQPRKERAQQACGGKLYHDYRELLANPDVDAVLIATPEHWHHRMACDALDAGKDVYLEKPMCRYIEEAADIRDLAKRNKRVLTVGAQYTAEPKWKKARDLLPQLGKLVWSQTSYCRNSKGGEWNYGIDANVTPDKLDWKAFLGPAQDRPFDPERFFRWRKYWDYSSGICGDLFPHQIYPLMAVFGAEVPNRVVASGGIYVHKDREVPDTFNLLADFPSGHSLFVAGSTANQYGVDTVIRGHQARMELSSPTEIVIRPEQVYAEEVEEHRESVQGVPDAHREIRRNWLACLRSRETTVCGPDLAYAGMMTVGLAEVSFRESKVATYTVKPVVINPDHPGYFEGNRVMAPLKPTVDFLGGSVEAKDGVFTIKTPQHTAMLQVHSTKAVFDGQVVALDAATVIGPVPGKRETRTAYIPLKSFARLFGADVKWNAQAAEATLVLGDRQARLGVVPG